MKKNLNGLPIKTSLEDGDAYVDSPIYKEIPVYCGNEPMAHHELTHYRRTPLRWMKPGPNGKLVPR